MAILLHKEATVRFELILAVRVIEIAFQFLNTFQFIIQIPRKEFVLWEHHSDVISRQSR